MRQAAGVTGVLEVLRSSARNRGFSVGGEFVDSAGCRESAILLPDSMQQIVNGIASKPPVGGCGNGGREGANDKGDGGDVEGA